uniref:Uncharacterized protein n=1 Tax=Peromyscus maniculatus bairdii TaxID=230844 RepID=A0A8C8UDJ4_PERMB
MLPLISRQAISSLPSSTAPASLSFLSCGASQARALYVPGQGMGPRHAQLVPGRVASSTRCGRNLKAAAWDLARNIALLPDVTACCQCNPQENFQSLLPGGAASQGAALPQGSCAETTVMVSRQGTITLSGLNE